MAIDRMQRVLREDVLDVHQQQLLVLLLVLQAQADAADDFASLLARRIAQQLAHGLVDVPAVATRSRPPPDATATPRRARAKGRPWVW